LGLRQLRTKRHNLTGEALVRYQRRGLRIRRLQVRLLPRVRAVSRWPHGRDRVVFSAVENGRRLPATNEEPHIPFEPPEAESACGGFTSSVGRAVGARRCFGRPAGPAFWALNRLCGDVDYFRELSGLMNLDTVFQSPNVRSRSRFVLLLFRVLFCRLNARGCGNLRIKRPVRPARSVRLCGSPAHQAGRTGRSCSVRITRGERGNFYVLTGS
jgi:hypothetical protein